MITNTPIGLGYVKSVSAHNDFSNLTVDLRTTNYDSQAKRNTFPNPTYFHLPTVNMENERGELVDL